MTPARRFGPIDLLFLLLILATAASVRAWYVWEWAGRGNVDGPVRVQDDRHAEVDAQLRHLREEQRFSGPAPFTAEEQPTAWTAPGYTWLAYLLTQIPGEGWETRLRWTQVGLGALTAVCYFSFVLLAFGSRPVAVLAGLFCACHPFWVAAVPEINDGVLTAFLLGLALLLGARGARSGGVVASLLYGLTLAGLVLVRAALLPFAFVALAWYLFRCRSLARGWLCALLAFLGFANGGLPWAVRNVQEFHDVLPVVDSTYYHLWMGNNPLATGGPMEIGPRGENALEKPTLADALAKQEGGEPRSRAEELGRVAEPQRFARLAPLVVREMRDNPAATLRRRLWAGFCFLVGEDWLQKAAANKVPFDEAVWIADALPAVCAGVLLAMLLLAVLGWHRAGPWRRTSVPAALAFLLVPLPYLLSHGEALQGPRLPLDGVLLSYAAFALVACVPGIGGELRRGGLSPEKADDEARR